MMTLPFVILLGAELLTLLLVAVLLLRRPAQSSPDARSERLLNADLPTQLSRVDARSEALERHLHAELAELRRDTAEGTDRSQEGASRSAEALRRELLGSLQVVRETLHGGFEVFRSDHQSDAERLRQALDAHMESLGQRMAEFTAGANKDHRESREALHASLNDLRNTQGEHQERLRGIVEERLDKLNEANAAKLEEMRATVDEKLHATLHTRLTESFGLVTEQLIDVGNRLGEMNTLTHGVQDLNRLFSNVKSRGGFAEVQLGNLLEQVLAPGQYVRNARIKKNTQEVVEYAVQFPGTGGEPVLLPIDAKFPKEDWERLESAYERAVPEDIERSRKAFDAAIRTEGKRICSKYIYEPVTTPYAIMFLPTEGLYAEVLRRDGLQSELHQNCKVMVAGPSNLYALLTSFQLGFRMLNLQKKGNEVWKVLGETRTEFGKFGTLMDKIEKKMGEAQNVMHDLNVRTRSITRKLGNVSVEDGSLASGIAPEEPLAFPGLLSKLAAVEEVGRTGSEG